MADYKNLYAFEKLCRYLHIPSKCNIWQEITKELTIEEQLNNIEFTKEGVLYTDSKGNKWLGYVYKKYKALGNGGKDNYPRMHLCHCGVTETWGKAPYIFSNTIPVECYNTNNNNAIKRIDNITMCKNCIIIRKNKRWKIFKDAKLYVKYIRKNYDLEDSQIVNRWGFTQDWSEIRATKLHDANYCCDHCHINLNSVIGNTFLHVYHIDRNLANNDASNLRCLCTECYCNSSDVNVTDALFMQRRAYRIFLEDYLETSTPSHNTRSISESSFKNSKEITNSTKSELKNIQTELEFKD